MMFLWCVLVLVNLVSVATGTNAGVKVRLTQKGLEYGKQNNTSCNSKWNKNLLPQCFKKQLNGHVDHVYVDHELGLLTLSLMP